MNVNVIDSDWISTREAADKTGYTQEYIRQLARTKKIESTKIGPALMISAKSLMEYHREQLAKQ